MLRIINVLFLIYEILMFIVEGGMHNSTAFRLFWIIAFSYTLLIQLGMFSINKLFAKFQTQERVNNSVVYMRTKRVNPNSKKYQSVEESESSTCSDSTVSSY